MALERKVLALKEVAAYLGVHPSTIYRMLYRGEITGFKIGSDWKFNLEAIDKWRLEHQLGQVDTGKSARKSKPSSPAKK